MSVSGVMVFPSAVGVGLDNDGNPTLLINYKYSRILRNVEGGQIGVTIAGRTESEMSTVIQQKILDHVNGEMTFDENFVLSDVIGGRV